jgi:hypothetical protein
MQAVWLMRHRLRQLEDELARAKADQAELRWRLERFEKIAAAAGADVGTPAPPAPMPPSLLAAARELHRREAPVRLDVAGTEVIAVIGGAGDPREWWAAIVRLTDPAYPARSPRETS